MDTILEAPVVLWQLAFVLIALLVPVWIISKLVQAFTATGKKTYRNIRK
jgi:hypothetical protein